MDPLITAIAGKAVTEAGKAAVGAAGETLGNAAAGAATDTGFVNALLGKVSLTLGDCFQRYLRNAEASYNEVRTLATGSNLRTILGENSIYVSVNLGLTVGHAETEIPASNVEALLKFGNRILIVGSGGMGKSMLMRYMFLDTIRRGAYMKKPYIPVFLELRRVSEQKPGQVSIPELVYACMRNHDVELKSEHFIESLRMGKYLFLLDGFDEVKDSLSAEVAEKLNDFSTQYPQNAFIVTSRPANDYENAPFRNFVKMRCLPLNKAQTVELAQKISITWTWQSDREKAEDFCRQLKETLYYEHESFAENPLLLSMMFLTFMRNSSIPNHEAEFYRESYDVLYSKHDTHDKGSFHREFKCGDLSKEDFTKLFARFCFQSCMFEQYEFSEQEILHFLQQSIDFLKLSVKAEDSLSDLRKIVCMIVRDGNVYRFAHRSFQEYFAAVYTAGLSDDAQKLVLGAIIEEQSTFEGKRHLYYRLLFQIEGERFKVNALEEKLRGWLNEAENSDNPDVFLLKHMISALAFYEGTWTPLHFKGDFMYLCVTTGLLQRTFALGSLKSPLMRPFETRGIISWGDIDNFGQFTVQERQWVYAFIAKELRVFEFRANIQQWLNELDTKRKVVKLDGFFQNL